MSEEERVKMLKKLDSSSENTSLKTIKIENYMQLEEHHIKRLSKCTSNSKLTKLDFQEKK